MKNQNNMKPQYRDLKFKTDAQFQKWLTETARFKIDFRDYGQDLQTIWTDEHGEILHANLQTGTWCGKFVDVTRLKIGKGILMNVRDSFQFNEMNFVVKQYTDIGKNPMRLS